MPTKKDKSEKAKKYRKMQDAAQRELQRDISKRSKAKQPVGRPTKYTEELAETICNRLSKGETVRAITRDSDMPSRQTIHTWLSTDKHKGFLGRYTQARKEQAEGFAEEIIEIADENQFDMTEDESGKPMLNWEHIQRSKLKIDARKWFAAKTHPKVYGDFQRSEVSGPDGAPLKVENTPKMETYTLETWLRAVPKK